MAVKKCCIDNCKSCSTRKEDKGVTYHKFPKNVALRDIWINVTHNKHTDTELPKFVCSRHFCKNDFQSFKDSKYKLRTDAVPSIFPWDSDTDEEMDDITAPVEGFGKDCEIENVDAIKKFIEAQEKEIQEQREADIQSKKNNEVNVNKESTEEPLCVASSVIEMILNESELEIAKKKDVTSKEIYSPIDKGNGSMALSIGSKVEAKDFGDEWHPAEINEVDYEDMEVLVHYLDVKKHDEWISVSSPRLRPATTSAASTETAASTVKPGPSSEESVTDTVPIASLKEEAKDVKVEDKSKLSYAVGERCLARWRDNRRFIATILRDLKDGNYEIVFDDGCHWTCNTSRLHKLRSKSGEGDATSAPLTYGAGPSNTTPQSNTQFPSPAFHTHLFDPTRDYLGSKSERREMKRKLNIKEIFNIGQKKSRKNQKEKSQTERVERKPRILKKRREKVVKVKIESEVKTEVKTELPAVDAVASIIGTVSQEQPTPEGEEVKLEVKEEEKTEQVQVDTTEEVAEGTSTDVVNEEEPVLEEHSPTVDNEDLIQLEDLKGDLDPVLDEEVKLEQFEKPDDVRHEEVIDRIKEVINKLEDGLNNVEKIDSPKVEPKEEVPPCPEVKPEPTQEPKVEVKEESQEVVVKDRSKKLKVKKGKKLRLMQEKKVKIQVEKVKSELEEMKKQFNEMRAQMMKGPELLKGGEMPESFLLPGEWCCRWVNGQPVGTVSEIESEPRGEQAGPPPLPRRSVQVEDKRLPEGWTKHMVRRSFGHSAGKWDVVLVGPDNRRFHTKNEMRVYLENKPELVEQGYSHALTDFGVHLKLARRLGWMSLAASAPRSTLPAGTLSTTSPLFKRSKLSLKKKRDRDGKDKHKRPRLTLKVKVPKDFVPEEDSAPSPGVSSASDSIPAEPAVDVPPLEDGYVYVGSLKVQIIENLLRCPAEGCFKNFRNNTLLQMHIKHYHRELREMMGATPKVLDLAYARTMPVAVDTPRVKEDSKIIKVKIPRHPKREEPKLEVKDIQTELQVDTAPLTPVKESDSIPIPRSQDSPKLRQALINKPVKRPRVLLPVRRPEPEPVIPDPMNEEIDVEDGESMEPIIEMPPLDMALDFESAISTHTVTKPVIEKKRKGEKKRKTFALAAKRPASEEEDWFGANSDFETRSSFPRSGTPDSKADCKAAAVSSESNEETKDANMYMFTENGERIKIVHMKREEIINCHCGFREEDGLMVQCELCLCWQHAMCHNIQRECDVPEKYTCSICLNPRRGRRSQRFLHDQDRMYEGLLPAGKPCETLRRSHEVAGNLLRIEDALQALRVKYYVATKKDHPKLYLWAKDWEQVEIQYTQEKLNSDYSDLNIMINSMDKENQPLKTDAVKDLPMDIRTPTYDDHEHDRYSQREGPLGSHSLLSGLLSSPGGASLDLPISTSELERLAKSVQEQESQRAVVSAPQPEAPIENAACRRQLLKHLQRCQALIDARLDSIEAQVAELESQDPSFEDDETANYYPRTKQTVQMLMRDLDTMEELGVIT
ncbi:hypothetical protein PYW07_014342 [Mythimna separata]|uniref:PHD finger protein 20-like n=1 Tax=Mythimna separata TaxID=271217 RepID=A0AAD7YZB0_MYTSE|nr:hypothetical protein PYW07_014342 [Mythimna separata]